MFSMLEPQGCVLEACVRMKAIKKTLGLRVHNCDQGHRKLFLGHLLSLRFVKAHAHEVVFIRSFSPISGRLVVLVHLAAPVTLEIQPEICSDFQPPLFWLRGCCSPPPQRQDDTYYHHQNKTVVIKERGRRVSHYQE